MKVNQLMQNLGLSASYANSEEMPDLENGNEAEQQPEQSEEPEQSEDAPADDAPADDTPVDTDDLPPVEEPVFESIPSDEKTEEILELNASVESFNEALEEVHDTETRIDKLEELQKTVVSSDDEGGLTETGANLARQQLETITDKPVAVAITPSLESFGRLHGRRVSSMEFAKNIGEVLKAFFINAGKAIMNVLRAAYDAVARLFSVKKDFELLSKELKARSKGMKTGTFDIALSAREAGLITIDNNIEKDGNKLTIQYSKLVALTGEVVDDTSLFEYAKKVSGLKFNFATVEEVRESVEKATDVLGQFPKLKYCTVDKATSHQEQARSGCAVMATPLQLGEFYLWQSTEKPASSTEYRSGVLAAQTIRTERVIRKDDEVAIKSMTASNVEAVGTMLGKMAEYMVRAESKTKTIKDTINTVDKFFNQLSKSVEKIDVHINDVDQNHLRGTITAARRTVSCVSVPLVSVLAHAVSVSKVLARVAGKSIKGATEASAQKGTLALGDKTRTTPAVV